LIRRASDGLPIRPIAGDFPLPLPSVPSRASSSAASSAPVQHVRGAERQGGRWAHTYAALDLGTNNCRLLVARPTQQGFRVVDAFSRIVRLGEGLGTDERLGEKAMARTVSALQVCAEKMARHRVTLSRCVATEACRRARNGAGFIEQVGEQTGLRFEIIDGAEEARLALRGCSPLFDAPLRGDGEDFALLFDIGGGSTQISWVRLLSGAGAAPETEIVSSTSIPCGVVTLSESFGAAEGADGRLCADTFAQLRAHVAAYLLPFERAHRIADHIARRRVQMVGTSGTVTTLTGILLNLPRYNRSRVDGTHLTFADLQRATTQLAALDRAERAAHPCVGPDRADLVLAGCAVLDAICELWPVGRLRVGDRGLREGILHGLMNAADLAGCSG
jgi:exopolyphosphatase/guanosine-5'-triphosphate,3'-diphosphate pyrophosphatase